MVCAGVKLFGGTYVPATRRDSPARLASRASRRERAEGYRAETARGEAREAPLQRSTGRLLFWKHSRPPAGAQMLFVPQKMVTDHFDAPATPLLQFWIRGSSCAFLGLVYTLYTKVPVAEALPIATAVSFACGALYPWNAKFGYISPGLPVKYPMHYVPEILMVALTVLGIKAMM